MTNQIPDFQPIEINGVTYYTNAQMHAAFEAGRKAGTEEASEECVIRVNKNDFLLMFEATCKEMAALKARQELLKDSQ